MSTGGPFSTSGEGPNLEIPKDAEIVDLSKSWVMPGLMDAHTHVTSGQKNWELELSYLHEDSAYRALRGLKTAQVLLNAGITTVRDVGNNANYAAVDLRKAIDQGWFKWRGGSASLLRSRT